jgi:hypothetical protein
MVLQYRPPVGVQVKGVQWASGPALHSLSWQVQLALLQVAAQ